MISSQSNTNHARVFSVAWLPGLFVTLALAAHGQEAAPPRPIAVDLSRYNNGPVQVAKGDASLDVTWKDGQSREWQASFSLDGTKPLITAIRTGGKAVVERARPVYFATTGKRRGGWDAFFDFPPSHP